MFSISLSEGNIPSLAQKAKKKKKKAKKGKPLKDQIKKKDLSNEQILTKEISMQYGDMIEEGVEDYQMKKQL